MQISYHDFGTRSAVSVRGIKLIADGIPNGIDDVWARAATFNLNTAERIRDGVGPPSIGPETLIGSDGLNKKTPNHRGRYL